MQGNRNKSNRHILYPYYIRKQHNLGSPLVAEMITFAIAVVLTGKTKLIYQ
jgi:hypothetical protein